MQNAKRPFGIGRNSFELDAHFDGIAAESVIRILEGDAQIHQNWDCGLDHHPRRPTQLTDPAFEHTFGIARRG
ncbi:hypothetical protein [uncultured Corynebacterium sp.]|uniref:hypothetical protein n=1 Tax=uncultured Corynebacterium sp. TaxID=159447 RepID=UPI0025950B55|nr:hypothetical protein [uncultured Corynebacterium sp.]